MCAYAFYGIQPICNSFFPVPLIAVICSICSVYNVHLGLLLVCKNVHDKAIYVNINIYFCLLFVKLIEIFVFLKRTYCKTNVNLMICNLSEHYFTCICIINLSWSVLFRCIWYYLNGSKTKLFRCVKLLKLFYLYSVHSAFYRQMASWKLKINQCCKFLLTNNIYMLNIITMDITF